ncbi:acetyltransferase [Butyrivibrio proteoclasticus]|uniref:PglD-related sugar-binding protein n=1 Tax=Butyrivibrio proteoclasticus TaxID=43305 RepID=UPI00047A4343|nr:acetyltransferase [Butyrivibrio proteoclasticus]
MKSIVIMGAGELGKEVLWLIEDINKIEPTWLVLGLLDDTKKVGEIVGGYPVLGGMDHLEDLYKTNDCYAVIALQNGADKAAIADKHKDFNRWASIVHPTAVIAPQSTLGAGSIVFPQVTVSVDSMIGKHSLLYIHAIICNDCKLGEFTSIMSGVSLAEHVTVGTKSYLSAGCDVYPHVTIGQNCKVAVGVTVNEDMSDGSEKKQKNGFFNKY